MAGFEALAAGRRSRGAVDDGARSDHLVDDLEDQLFAELHPYRAELNHRDVAEEIHDETG
jgi:hypothetical protein